MDFPVGIRQHGTGLQIRIKHKGTTYSWTIPTKNPHSKRSIASAVQEREDLKRRLKMGLPILLGENSENALLADIAKDYLETLDVEYSTAASYVRLLNQHWLPNFGHWLITDLRPSHIKKYLNSYKNPQTSNPLASKTKKNALVPLSNLFNHAIADGLMDVNPCSAVKFKKEQKAEVERFTPREKTKILKKLKGDALVYFTIMFETGMRPSEILALKWEDFDGETFHVCKAIVWRKVKPSTKNHEIRKVFISDLLKETLAKHDTRFKKSHILLNSIDGPCLDTDDFNGAWKDALSRAEVRYRIPYTCRHTRASAMITGGLDDKFGAGQLGHTIEMYHRTYGRWISELGDQAQVAKLKKVAELWIEEGKKNA